MLKLGATYKHLPTGVCGVLMLQQFQLGEVEPSYAIQPAWDGKGQRPPDYLWGNAQTLVAVPDADKAAPAAEEQRGQPG